MDSFTAIGLAANVIQLVDFGARLLSGAHEIYHSTTGQLVEHVELLDIAESLSRLSENILPALLDPQSRYTDEKEIRSIAVAAKAVADELVAVIQNLKLTDGPKRKWRSFRQALATLWNKDKIENLQSRLERLRSQLSTQILAHIR